MLVLPAPAKINLYLHITGKRNDGYHALDTVFQLIDWQDTMRLQARADGQIVLHTPIAGLPDDKHLAVRAARTLRQAKKVSQGADIWVDKHIPSGAGLGGGSSDAATTLMGLNHVWRCGLSHEQLQQLGLQLGADVPFFCSGFGTAHALGVGEVLTPLPTQAVAYIVVYPNCHVPTPAVFKHPSLTWAAHQSSGFNAFAKDSNAFAVDLRNDLQTPACLIAPQIQQAIKWLSAAPNCHGVRMSGSGSAVFAQFASQALAQAALDVLKATQPSSTWQVRQVNSLRQHPIFHSALDFFLNSV